jgi:hypothetical protein
VSDRADRHRRETAQLVREIRARIWAWDPVGLHGAPDDEYDCLIGPVTGGLREGLTPGVLAQRLGAFIGEHFGVNPPPDTELFAEKTTTWYANEGRPSAW